MAEFYTVDSTPIEAMMKRKGHPNPQRLRQESLLDARRDFIQIAMARRGMTKKELAVKAGISRQTLDNYLYAVGKTSTETLQKIANVLKVDVSSLLQLLETEKYSGEQQEQKERTEFHKLIEEKLPLLLPSLGLSSHDALKLLLYLRKTWYIRRGKHRGRLHEGDYSSFLCDLTYPDDSFVYVRQVFSKKWLIQNTGSVPWINRRLRCTDEEPIPVPPGKEHSGYYLGLNNRLKPHQREVEIPRTEPGEPAELQVIFTAPLLPCTAYSYWKMVDKNGELSLKNQIGVYCRVIVLDK